MKARFGIDPEELRRALGPDRQKPWGVLFAHEVSRILDAKTPNREELYRLALTMIAEGLRRLPEATPSDPENEAGFAALYALMRQLESLADRASGPLLQGFRS